MYDVSRDRWSSELMDWLSIDPSSMPERFTWVPMSETLRPHDRAVLVGGWSRLPPVRALKKELLDARCPTGIGEAGALGAARAGGVAAGVYASIDDLPGAHQEVYQWT